MLTPRRHSLKALGIATFGLSVAATAAAAADEIPSGAATLEALTNVWPRCRAAATSRACR